MLQVIRSKATSFVIKVLFALLIASFAVWGIGDIFRNRGTDTTVATVGGRTITVEKLNEQVRSDMERLRTAMGGNIDLEQAKQLGLVDRALQSLINGDLFDLEIARLKLGVGNDTVRQVIVNNPNFRNDRGEFDRAIYTRVLAANRMSEPQFETLLRRDIARQHLVEALTAGMTPPEALVDALYRAQAERRIADAVTLPATAAGEIPAPSEADLKQYWDQHQSEFRTPELRNFTVATLRLDDVAAAINVPDDKLKSEYQAREAEYHTPEQRQVEQILLPNKEKAEAAEKELDAGKDFAAVAKEVADAAPDTLDLGLVKREDLPAPLADVAFSLKEGEVGQPVETAFGWHILRVVQIKPEETQPFDEVKDKVKLEVARDMAGDEIAKTANRIEDAIAAGSSLADVAQKFAMKTTTAEGIDITGHDAGGKAVDLPQPQTNVLRTAFDTAAGQMSQLSELGDEGYYIVQVDKVTPARVKPLEEVKEEASQMWLAERRREALQKLGDEIAGEVNGGKPLAEVAATHKLAVTTTPPLPRTGGGGAVPPALVAKLFEAKPGAAVTAPAGEGYAVAQLKEIQPADPAKDPAAVAQLKGQVGNVMQNDMLDEFDQALRQRFPVEVNQAKLDQLL